MRELAPLAPYFRPYRWYLASGLTAVVLSASVGLVAPLVIGQAIDALEQDATRRTLFNYGALFVAVTLVRGVFQFAQRMILVAMSRHIEFDLSNAFFAQLERLPAAFYERYATGDLMARATNDLQAVRMVCGPAIMYTANTVVTALGALVFLLHIHPLMTVVALGPLPLAAVISKIFGQRIHVFFQAVQASFSDLSARVQENLSGARIVRAYAQERREQGLFDELNQRYVDRNRRLIRWNAALSPLLQGVIGLGYTAVLWYGCRLLIVGEITMGQYVTFNLFLSKLIWPMISIGWVINLTQRAAASFGRMHAILRLQHPLGGIEGGGLQPAVRDEEPVREPEASLGIHTSGLTFRYAEDRPAVLSGLDLEIEPGQTVAIVGRTGAGKSTLLKLLPRLADPDRGQLFVGGTDVRRWPLAALRRAIAMVPQESLLFSTTIGGNIAVGRPEASAAEIREAARLAGLDRDLEDLPDGLDTMVGERGITLSGGQKQRVALARALARDAPILVLDDCLSAVDAETEERILTNLGTVFPGRTVLQVSHRVSAVRGADQILVLDAGEIRERGTHEELIARQGLYADLELRQRLEEQLAAV